MLFEQPLFDIISGTIKIYKEIYVLTQEYCYIPREKVPRADRE